MNVEYYKSKTNGVVFDDNCDQLTEIDYPDLYYYDKDAASWAREFMETSFTIPEDGISFKRGEKTRLLQWQNQHCCNLYGIKEKATGLRRYWYNLNLIPKKQGKSPYAAMNSNYILMADGQGRGTSAVIANDKPQARIIHDNLKQMIYASEFLQEKLAIRRDYIEHPKSASKVYVMSADAPGKHGFNWSAIFYDEPHAAEHFEKAEELYDTMTYGIAARAEPIVMMTSTAGMRGNWFHTTKYEYAKRLLTKQIRDDKWLVFLYEADPLLLEDQYGEEWWTKEEVWADVNPSYNVTVGKKYYEAQVQQIRNDPDRLNGFFNFYTTFYL